MLLSAHLDRVVYENIDQKLRRPLPSLDTEASMRRVAVQMRGGCCFLLVDAFAGLLGSLGFAVSLHTAVCAAEPPPPEKWGDHVVALVHLGGQAFVADVGLGEGPRAPFALAPGSWEEAGFGYGLEERPEEGGWRFANPANATGTVPGFTVDTSTSAVGLREFDAFHRYYWTHADSGYVKGPVALHRKTASGDVLSLRGCTLHRTSPQQPGGKGHEALATVSSSDAWFSLARDTFFLPLDDISTAERENLWAIVAEEHAAWMARTEETGCSARAGHDAGAQSGTS